MIHLPFAKHEPLHAQVWEPLVQGLCMIQSGRGSPVENTGQSGWRNTSGLGELFLVHPALFHDLVDTFLHTRWGDTPIFVIDLNTKIRKKSIKTKIKQSKHKQNQESKV